MSAPDAVFPPHIALYGYEDLLAEMTAIPQWPQFDENTASGLCYTSGTTGRPKGVLYSHRACLLHAMSLNAADVVGLKATDRALAIVPMFHVNGWGVPYAAPMVGRGAADAGHAGLDAPSLLALMNGERATVSVGVPTIWMNLLASSARDRREARHAQAHPDRRRRHAARLDGGFCRNGHSGHAGLGHDGILAGGDA